MAGSLRVYPLTFASGTTSTTSAYVGNCAGIMLYHSGTTAWNSATGNVDIYLRGGIGTENGASSLTHFRIQSALISTDISGGVYNWPSLLGVEGMPRYSVEFGTAVTGSSANTIYLIAMDSAY